MKKNILIFTLLLFSISSFSQEYIFKFKINSKKELKKITEIVSIDNFKNNEITAYANPKQFEEFKLLGYKYEIMPHPFTGKALTMATTVAQMANWDKYPTFEVLNQMIDNFATNYPNICRVETIGMSEEGRAVKVVKISDNPDTDEEEPEFFYTGQMHGDEVVDYVLFLRLIDYMLENYGTDPRVTNLIDNMEIWINPLSNPDGTFAGGNNTISSATRLNSNGVDLNRNFPTPNLPSPSGMNEAEVQMMMTFADNHNFVMSANTHSGAELVNYPWDSWYSSDKKHADHNWFSHISYNYADTVHQNSSGYFFGQGDGVTHGADWYLVNGSRQDYMTYFQNCREVTLELSDAKDLDASLLPAHWNYNRSAFLGYLEECLYGFNGTVKNTNGDPLNAKIEITSHDIDNSEVYTDPAKGDYYRPIEPGTYNVTYSSYGYISQTISVTVTDWETTTIQNVVLQQATQVDVTGTVTEDGTGNPIENVKIEFLNTPLSPVYTDASGNYTVTGVWENNYDIKASKSGYTAVIQNIDILTTNTVVDFTLSISNAVSFESNVPSFFTFSGDSDWSRVTPEAYDGDYSMKSGDISNNQISVMETELNITAAGTISFYKKVSSESGYDYLKFYIDGVQQGSSWSGEVNWSQETFPVTTTGIHTFKWEYSKDGSVSNGSDCAWVDYIEFPQYEIPPTYTVTFNVNDGTNPIENATVNFNAQNKNTDAGGHAVFTEVSPQNNMAWSVSKTGYNSENGTINVSDADVNKNVVLTEIVTYTVTFNVVDASSSPIEAANVNFNSQNISTDASGHAVFNSVETGNNLPYIVTKTGYTNFNGTLNVVDADVQENVTMNDITYTVTFIINDGTNPIENANVNFNSQDILTDATGKAIFNNIPEGNNLPYIISKSGFLTFNGTLNVNSNINQTISLTTVNVDVILKLSGLKFTPNPFKDFVSIQFYSEEKANTIIYIYSYSGQLVKSINIGNLNAGNHEYIWNASGLNGEKVKNGIYFIKIKSGNNTQTGKLILVN